MNQTLQSITYPATDPEVEATDRPPQYSGSAHGITFINDSPWVVTVVAFNETLGFRACAIVTPKAEMILPVGWAWWDILGIAQSEPETILFFRRNEEGTLIHTNGKKYKVGYRATVKWSEMTD